MFSPDSIMRILGLNARRKRKSGGFLPTVPNPEHPGLLEDPCPMTQSKRGDSREVTYEC